MHESVSINEAIGQQEQGVPEGMQMGGEIPVQQPKGMGVDFSFLKKPTGEGDVLNYMEHPLNFNNSKGMARVLRGLTGLIGEMNYAIIDIFVGVLDLSKGKKAQ